MHQSRATKRVGVTPSVLRGFDVAGFHRTVAEYEDRVPDGEVLIKDNGERFPEIGRLTLPFTEVMRPSLKAAPLPPADEDDDIPTDVRMLAGGSNFAQPLGDDDTGRIHDFEPDWEREFDRADPMIPSYRRTG